jgi:tRNA nucleotidyltransferase (CCA-adding enzyme)
MDAKVFLKKVDFLPGKEEISEIKEKTKIVVEWLNQGLNEAKIDADVFVGGSLAKNTIVKNEDYDVDIFIRFDWKYENLSEDLEKVVNKIASKNNLRKERIHGSRDYFRIGWDNKVTFEIIPVVRIKKANEARNVTDLSYFHVNYVKSRLKNEGIKREVRIAKKFFKANKIYGAESYIQGFSGYGLECLIINYKTFYKLINEILKAKDRIIIDYEKMYKKKNEILLELNESRLQGPIILIDPTWKERNVLAGLNNETFLKSKEIISEFLKNPSMSFFEKKPINFEELQKISKKNKAELLKITLETNKQEGDIAGTKLKKFSRFLTSESKGYFDIIKEEFTYSLGKEADLYLILRRKKEYIKLGPPEKLKDAASKFKKMNKNVFSKGGYLNARVKIEKNGREFFEEWIKKYNDKIKQMSIVSIGLADN